MVLESHFALRHEISSDTASERLSYSFATLESLGFGQAQTENNEQHRWASAEPKERAPAVWSGVDKTTRKRSDEQVTKGVTLLQHSRDNATGLWGTILQSGSSNVTIQTTHGNTEKSTAGQELFVGRTETGAQLQDDEENVVGDKGPFAAVAIREDTEDDGTDGTQHQHEGDTPGDFGVGTLKVFSQTGQGNRDGEEIKGIPSPATKGDLQAN